MGQIKKARQEMECLEGLQKAKEEEKTWGLFLPNRNLFCLFSFAPSPIDSHCYYAILSNAQK